MRIIILLAFLLLSLSLSAQNPRTKIDLDGTWEFDQTTNAFPPEKFTRTIPVPGLVHLAQPKIADYDKFFKRPERVVAKEQYNLFNLDYTPRYSWYHKKVFIPKELEKKQAMITILKSQYVTTVYVNGFEEGTSMACYTPVEFPVTGSLRFGAENDILIRVGERIWLPSEAAGGTDKEKEHYLPGIWDDVFLSFTGDMRINRLLVLPSVAGKKVIVKGQIRSFIPAQIFYGDPMHDTAAMEVEITEKISGRSIGKVSGRFSIKRDNITEVSLELLLPDFMAWTPETPFLYNATARLSGPGGTMDECTRHFGMRDFTTNGKDFYLSGQKYPLRGTNITLQRFFEDPDCGNLVWDREWVRKLLVTYPKLLNWNAMRICVGIVPDFWYDIADENGLMFQNEWLYWQNHGWNDEIKKEYTDWLWSDGSHPSIAIWDGINENTDEFIGNTLIPELKKLDPTRIWDAGYMREGSMKTDEMDEPHPYQTRIIYAEHMQDNFSYPLGDLDYKPDIIKNSIKAGVPQLVNEYGWIWLWRDGQPSKLTVETYDYYLGPNSTKEQNREFQAYVLQLETEWLRSEPSLAGVLAFCYLANNYGYTGDWFTGNIKDLTPSPVMNWFSHCFSQTALFINVADERYVKQATPHDPGEKMMINLMKVNDLSNEVSGNAILKIIDSNGKTASLKKFPVHFNSFDKSPINTNIVLPSKPGGYLITIELRTGDKTRPVISRRYIKVGKTEAYKYFDLMAGDLR